MGTSTPAHNQRGRAWGAPLLTPIRIQRGACLADGGENLLVLLNPHCCRAGTRTSLMSREWPSCLQGPLLGERVQEARP